MVPCSFQYNNIKSANRSDHNCTYLLPTSTYKIGVLYRRETREKMHQERSRAYLSGSTWRCHWNLLYQQAQRKRESLRQEGMTTNQCASYEPRSSHETSKRHCDNRSAGTPYLEQAHTHCPDSNQSNHSRGKEICMCSRAKTVPKTRLMGCIGH